MRLRRTMTVLASCALATVGLLAPAGPAGALFKLTCMSVGTGPVDPIVLHDQPSAMSHDHIFFGNKGLPDLGNNATYGQLLGRATSCPAGTGDTAAYWIPRLLVNGQAFAPTAVHEYYRSWDKTDVEQTTQAFPPDTRLIAGSSTATGPQPVGVVNWSCDERSDRSGPYTSPNQADCRTARPSGPNGIVRLTLHVTFPSCWDGVVPQHPAGQTGDTRDNAHFAYRAGATCPAGFAKHVPTLTQTYWWQQDAVRFANPQTISLSSGSQYTAHADFWNTWNQAGLRSMIEQCIHQDATTKSICGF